MLNFKLKNSQTGEEWLETSLTGKALLTIPQLNKDTAFSETERQYFGLLGKLPFRIETLEEQARRSYLQYQHYQTELQKNIYLNNLHGKNQVLFYKLVSEHLTEMLPLIYTPVIGTAVEASSQQFRQTKGLYLDYPHRNEMLQMLKNRSNPEIDLIVVTDGESILGLGDQGIAGMGISISKLMLYTLCAGIDPLRTLPIQLDVGTNNEKLLNDPFYLGWRQPRISQEEYDDFIKQFVTLVKQEFPNIFLHWEDLGRANAGRVLETYQDQLCTFNDDIQGTGAVALAAILAAVHATHTSLPEQRIIIFGAGTAGIGIADQIREAIERSGIPPHEAKQRFWLIDRQGLLTDQMDNLTRGQQSYARSVHEVQNWKREETGNISLLEVIKKTKPTILVGCSSVTNAFHQTAISQMAAHTERPIIFPLSNPTELSEATPKDILTWTNGKALIATGSPFEDVTFKGERFSIAQCNNALVFPGIGLGIIATKAKKLSGRMLWAACQALKDVAPILTSPKAPLLPLVQDIKKVAYTIADAVAKTAMQEGLAQINMNETELSEHIQHIIWQPHYLPYHLTK